MGFFPGDCTRELGHKPQCPGNSLMAHWAKDLAVSLLWVWLLLWRGSLAWKLPLAVCVAKTNKTKPPNPKELWSETWEQKFLGLIQPQASSQVHQLTEEMVAYSEKCWSSCLIGCCQNFDICILSHWFLSQKLRL